MNNDNAARKLVRHGFGGINDKASGDDVLLLQKAVRADKAKVHYLKNNDSIVKTKPENDLSKLFMQRVRWAGKTTGYDSSYAKMLAVVVLLMNLGLVVGCGLSVVGKLDWSTTFSLFAVKYSIDYILLYQSNAYLRKGKFFVPMASSIIYPLFSSLVGVYSLFGSFSWKGRRFSE